MIKMNLISGSFVDIVKIVYDDCNENATGLKLRPHHEGKDDVSFLFKFRFTVKIGCREYSSSKIKAVHIPKEQLKDCGSGVWLVSGDVRESVWKAYADESMEIEQ